MAYNFSLKSYANGTCQLTYYNTPVLSADDLKAFSYHSADNKRYFGDECREYDDYDNYTPWGYEELIEVGELAEIIESNDVNANDVFVSEVDDDAKRQRSLAVSINRTIRRIYDYGRNNVWDWFFTFTLSGDCVNDRTDYDECCKKVRTWLANIKKRKCPDMAYLLVPERHPTSGAWHFHALVSYVDNLTFVKAINQQEFLKDNDGNIVYDKKGQPVPNKYFGKHLRTSYPNGDYIYNIKDYGNGWSTATKVKDTKKAVSYIVKYITKDLAACTFGKRRFYPSMNLTLPERILGMYDKESLSDLISYIEYTYDVKLSMDYIKKISVNVDGYENKVSYLEFQKE